MIQETFCVEIYTGSIYFLLTFTQPKPDLNQAPRFIEKVAVHSWLVLSIASSRANEI